MDKCINCGKYPFCENIESASTPSCANYIKKPIESVGIKNESQKECCS